MANENKPNNKLIRPRHLKKLGIPGMIVILLLFIGVTVYNDNFAGNDDENSSAETSSDNVVTVDQHIDGDTTRFNYQGDTHNFRYLIINTPEIGRDGDEDDPYAEEAFERTQELLDNAQEITVEFDEEKTDHYDRYLAYVYVDGEMVNETLVREGLATVDYVHPPNDKYEDLLRDAEEEAKQDQVGVWSE
ncbi:thermonuclease family protein [Jeotgalicoccus huakuii]|nr:thermonuclease family protein [Jeotgalicoccus huakuii]